MEHVSYSTGTSTLTPGRIRGALRRYALAILACVVIGALIGYALGALAPTRWSATTSVLIKPLQGNPYNPTVQGTSLTNLETEAQLAESEVISERVVKDLGLSMSARDLAGRTSVSIGSNTQILLVTYRAPHEKGASSISRTIADEFLKYRSDRRDETVTSQQDEIAKRIDDVNQRLNKERSSANLSYQKLRALGGQLLNLRVQAANLAEATGSPGEVIANPSPQRDGLLLPPWMLAIVGALVGLVIGLAWSLFRERRSDVIRSEDELSGLDVLVVGHQRLRRQGRRRRAVARDKSARDVAIVLRQTATTPSVLAITDVEGAVGHNPLAEDVAKVLAQPGSSVVVIDAASTRPSRDAGLSDILLDENEKLAKLVQEQQHGVSVLPIGTEPHHVPALFSTPRFKSLISDALASFDWVLVTGPSPASTSGRSLLVSADYWVMVVTLGQSNLRETAQVVRSSRSFTAGLLGLVVTRPVRRG
jgi:polysaccharide biosynthesis transport protein